MYSLFCLKKILLRSFCPILSIAITTESKFQKNIAARTLTFGRVCMSASFPREKMTENYVKTLSAKRELHYLPSLVFVFVSNQFLDCTWLSTWMSTWRKLGSQNYFATEENPVVLLGIGSIKTSQQRVRQTFRLGMFVMLLFNMISFPSFRQLLVFVNKSFCILLNFSSVLFFKYKWISDRKLVLLKFIEILSFISYNAIEIVPLNEVIWRLNISSCSCSLVLVLHVCWTNKMRWEGKIVSGSGSKQSFHEVFLPVQA